MYDYNLQPYRVTTMPKSKASKSKAKVSKSSSLDDLRDLSNACDQILRSSAATSLVFKNKDIINAIADTTELQIAGGTLVRDITEFKGRLQVIKDKHNTVRGDSNDPDDNLTAIMIAEDYRVWMTDFNAVVIPTVNEIGAIVDPVLADPNVKGDTLVVNLKSPTGA